MKKLVIIIAGVLFTVSSANALTLYDFFHGHLPSLVERSRLYHYLDEYRGTAKQNTKLLSDLQKQPQGLKFGSAYNPSGGGTYRLQSSVGTSDTSLTLSSFKEPVSNIPYTMTYLNSSIEYGTIEPQNATSKEFVSFSGITQNSDGTAIITGLTRGLGFSYPYTASTTLQQSHPGQSIFILSNPPQLTNQYGNKNNSETITGSWSFSSIPINSSGGNATSTTQFVTLGELNSVSVTGAATSTDTVMGISALANNTDLKNGTASTTSGAPKVIASYLASTTPRTSAGYLPLTDSTGTIPAAYIATSSTSQYNFGATIGIGTSTPAGLFGVQGNSYTSGTTTSARGNFASSTNQINTVGTFATLATNLGNTTIPLTFYRNFALASSTGTSATTTLGYYALPANTLVANSILSIDTLWSGSGGSGCQFDVRMGNGTATTSIGFNGHDTSGNILSNPTIETTKIFAASASSQYAVSLSTYTNTNAANILTKSQATSLSQTLTGLTYLDFVGFAPGGNSTCTLNGFALTLTQ